jgi:GTP 3',8-cyclase
MYDRYSRNINYLRISVTDRCNLRCTYCMPESGITLLQHKEILTYDEIAGFTREVVKHGVTKVRITGGEPLVRKGIATLVEMISRISGITDLSMTTNGVLLGKYADDLRIAGLQRVNVSLDTIDPIEFATVTRTGIIEDVVEGIFAAKRAGLLPVKINCVIRQSKDEDSAREVSKFCHDNGLEIRYIRQMDLVNGHFSTVDGGTGGDCAVCNRLRLTSNGRLKPCLFSNSEFDIRELGYGEAIRLAVEHKPRCGTVNVTGAFYNIGG